MFRFNPFPNDKFLDPSKLTEFADISSKFDYEQFLFFPTVFSKDFFRQILDSSKLKEFADDNLKFDENCGKFSKWVENTVGKGEFARYEQLLLFPRCFQKTCTADT